MGSEVDVYGSHATKLCLHWSDIDLVLIPPSRVSHIEKTGSTDSNKPPSQDASTPTNSMNN